MMLHYHRIDIITALYFLYSNVFTSTACVPVTSLLLLSRSCRNGTQASTVAWAHVANKATWLWPETLSSPGPCDRSDHGWTPRYEPTWPTALPVEI